jgi:hypothetical protein
VTVGCAPRWERPPAAGAGTRDTYCQALYRRLAARRGKKRALVAVAHSQLIAAWHIIGSDVEYRDLGSLHFLSQVDRPRQTRRLVTQLQQMGYLVRLDPASAI